MFKQIVSNLSLSPSATPQLTFYWRRLRREQLTRQLSMVMAGALIVLQFATIIAPPDAANASNSGNDIMIWDDGQRSGINFAASKALMKKWDTTGNRKANAMEYISTHSKVRTLFNKYGITNNDIRRSHEGSIDANNDPELMSFGRGHYFAEDEAVSVGPGDPFYKKPLRLWPGSDKYRGLVGTTSQGRYFAIMFDCGNLVIKEQKPKQVAKFTAPKAKAHPVAVFTPGKPHVPVKHPVAHTPVVTPAPVITQTPTPTPETPTPTPETPGSPVIVQEKTGVLTSAADNSSNDANGATAQPGDSITYTLTTKNTGAAEQKDYVVTDDMTDILEYATVTDAGGGTLASNQLSWPAVTIAAGASYTTEFVVQVMDPLPTTPAAISDPLSFDLKINNVYGTVVVTNLTVPPVKQVEVAQQNLPDTGPATSTFIVLLLASAIAYFFFRNRQLANEVNTLRGDYHGGTA